MLSHDFGLANQWYACFQSCRIDVGVVHLMIIRISVQLGLLDVEEKIVYENVE